MRRERRQKQGDGPRGSPQSKDKSTTKPLPKHQAGTKGAPEAPGCDEGNVDSRWGKKKVPPSTGDTTAPCQCLGSAERVRGRSSEEMLPRGCPQPKYMGSPCKPFPRGALVGLLWVITPGDVPGHPEVPSLGFSCWAGVASASGGNDVPRQVSAFLQHLHHAPGAGRSLTDLKPWLTRQGTQCRRSFPSPCWEQVSDQAAPQPCRKAQVTPGHLARSPRYISLG